jgi:hypothetical protein
VSGLTATVQMTGLQAKLARVNALLVPALKSNVAQAAQLFEDEAKDTVHVVSGEQRDAIHTEVVTDEDFAQTLMVTPIHDASNKYGFDPAYARRLELGFIGTDSLGRHYHQPPFPYMRPARDNKQADASAAIVAGIREAIAEAGGA